MWDTGHDAGSGSENIYFFGLGWSKSILANTVGAKIVNSNIWGALKMATYAPKMWIFRFYFNRLAHKKFVRPKYDVQRL